MQQSPITWPLTCAVQSATADGNDYLCVSVTCDNAESVKNIYYGGISYDVQSEDGPFSYYYCVISVDDIPSSAHVGVKCTMGELTYDCEVTPLTTHKLAAYTVIIHCIRVLLDACNVCMHAQTYTDNDVAEAVKYVTNTICEVYEMVTPEPSYVLLEEVLQKTQDHQFGAPYELMSVYHRYKRLVWSQTPAPIVSPQISYSQVSCHTPSHDHSRSYQNQQIVEYVQRHHQRHNNSQYYDSDYDVSEPPNIIA